MNLEDVIDPEYGLQQDEWSLSKPRFGEEGQLEVVGWSGRNKNGKGAKYYILKCSKCSQDVELFKEGFFRSNKDNILNQNQVPCGCSKKHKWSQEQFYTLCCRKVVTLNYEFLGFEGEWKGACTKIKMSCEKHGEWVSGNVNNLVNNGTGCPLCGIEYALTAASKGTRTKPDDVKIMSFFASGSFHPDTKFWRSKRLDILGRSCYWHIFCPECGETGESASSCLQKGKRPCACNKQRQQEAYINRIVDKHGDTIAIKLGIARDSKQRVKQQDRQSAYEVRQYQVYSFPSVQQCKQAERECKKELECGVVLKRDMPDGWTETTWAYNIGKVKSIYERNGGVLV